MKYRPMTLAETALIALTRVMLGAGVGLLLAGRMDPKVRRGVGWSLLVTGALSTVPLLAHVLGKPAASPRGGIERLTAAPRRVPATTPRR